MKKVGYYFGTEINERWYRRYIKDGLFARGKGEYWFSEQGLYFLRYLTKEPLYFPFSNIDEIKLGNWHSGKWGQGYKVIKLIWSKRDQKFSSGFIFSKDDEQVMEIIAYLNNACKYCGCVFDFTLDNPEKIQ